MPKVMRTKSDPVARKGVMFGYGKDTKAYGIYDPTTSRTINARDVVFDDGRRWTDMRTDRQGNCQKERQGKRQLRPTGAARFSKTVRSLDLGMVRWKWWMMEEMQERRTLERMSSLKWYA